MKNLLTAAQVGERLGVNGDTARRYIRAHMVHIMLPGGDLRVEEAEVERWISTTRRTPEDSVPPRTRKPRKPCPYNPELFEPDGRIKRRHTK